MRMLDAPDQNKHNTITKNDESVQFCSHASLTHLKSEFKYSYRTTSPNGNLYKNNKTNLFG